MFSRSATRAVRAAAPASRFVAAPRAPAVRTYAAAAAAATENVRPPVAVFGLDGTYATALVRDPRCCLFFLWSLGQLECRAPIEGAQVWEWGSSMMDGGILKR